MVGRRGRCVEPDGAVHPRPLDSCLAFQLQTELHKERGSSRKVVDDDAYRSSR